MIIFVWLLLGAHCCAVALPNSAFHPLRPWRDRGKSSIYHNFRKFFASRDDFLRFLSAGGPVTSGDTTIFLHFYQNSVSHIAGSVQASDEFVHLHGTLRFRIYSKNDKHELFYDEKFNHK